MHVSEKYLDNDMSHRTRPGQSNRESGTAPILSNGSAICLSPLQGRGSCAPQPAGPSIHKKSALGEVIQRGRQLRDSREEDFTNIRISPDKTEWEWEQDAMLKEKLQEKEDKETSGKYKGAKFWEGEEANRDWNTHAQDKEINEKSEN